MPGQLVVHAHMSLWEGRSQTISVHTAESAVSLNRTWLQVLSDARPHELWSRLYAKVEKITMRRIRALARRLGDKPVEGIALQKREVLEQTVERVGARRARL